MEDLEAEEQQRMMKAVVPNINENRASSRSKEKSSKKKKMRKDTRMRVEFPTSRFLKQEETDIPNSDPSK